LIKEILVDLKSSEKGLTDDEAVLRLKQYGPNQIEEAERVHPIVIFLQQFKSPIVWVLALMILGLILTRRLAKRPRYRLGRYILFLGTCILFLFSIEPVSNLLVYSLECQYKLPSEEILSTLDVVVILGGGMYASGGFREDIRKESDSVLGE